MSESIVKQAKESVKNKHKEENAMKNAQRKETFKTILITILITGIIAFVCGVKYKEAQIEQVHEEAKSLVTAVSAKEASKE